MNNALSQATAAPPNNSFANRFLIAIPTGTTSITATGNNLEANKETGEPSHAGNGGGRSVWWEWTPGINGTVTISTKGSGMNTLLGVYTGTSVGALTSVASDDVTDGYG